MSVGVASLNIHNGVPASPHIVNRSIAWSTLRRVMLARVITETMSPTCGVMCLQECYSTGVASSLRALCGVPIVLSSDFDRPSYIYWAVAYWVCGVLLASTFTAFYTAGRILLTLPMLSLSPTSLGLTVVTLVAALAAAWFNYKSSIISLLVGGNRLGLCVLYSPSTEGLDMERSGVTSLTFGCVGVMSYGYMWCTFVHKESNTVICVFNCHLGSDRRYAEAVADAADVLRKSGMYDAIVITGMTQCEGGTAEFLSREYFDASYDSDYDIPTRSARSMITKCLGSGGKESGMFYWCRGVTQVSFRINQDSAACSEHAVLRWSAPLTADP